MSNLYKRNETISNKNQSCGQKVQGGFTLVELMIVLVILVILAAASTPIFRGYAERAKYAPYYEEMHQVRQALQVARTETMELFDFASSVNGQYQIWYPVTLSGDSSMSAMEKQLAEKFESYVDKELADRVNYWYYGQGTPEDEVTIIQIYFNKRGETPYIKYEKYGQSPEEITLVQ